MLLRNLLALLFVFSLHSFRLIAYASYQKMVMETASEIGRK